MDNPAQKAWSEYITAELVAWQKYVRRKTAAEDGYKRTRAKLVEKRDKVLAQREKQ